MAKGLYASIGSTTKKIKKNYAVVGGTTRKIKKMYAVVGGVTRLIFNSEIKPGKHGTASSGLSERRDELFAASVGDYAVFAGGGMTYSSAVVDAYNKSLTRSTPTSLSTARERGGNAGIGNYAIFAGGHSYVSSRTSISSVETYNTSLTRGSAGSLQSSREDMASVVLGSYAIFAHGENYTSSGSYTSNYDTYTASLTHGTGYMYYGLSGVGAASVGNYAVFAGGASSSGRSSNIQFINSSLTTSMDYTYLNEAVMRPKGASTADYALICGGGNASSPYATTLVTAWNASLTKSNPTALSVAKSEHAAISLNGYVIVGGGFSNGAAVNVYDNSLTRTVLDTMTALAYCNAATTGNYALFAGSSSYNTVEVYKVD